MDSTNQDTSDKQSRLFGIFPRKKVKTQENPQAKPTNSLSTSKSFYFGGRAASGVYVSEDTAMRNAAVYACVRVISETIAGLPLNIYEYDGDGRKLAPEHALHRILHYEPNPEMDSFVFRETLMSHLLLYGNAYAQIVHEKSGRIKALYPLLPDKVDVRRSESGDIYYVYWRNADEKRRGDTSGAIVLEKECVLHIVGLSFNGLVGYSPIGFARDAIGLAMATEEYGAEFFSNSATPGGIIESTGTLDNPEELRKTWELLYKGNNKTHSLAVLEEGLSFKQVSIPPNAAQFLETRKYQTNEICRIFRVPPHMIADLEKSSFNNIEQQGLEFKVYTIDPWVSRLEQAMTRQLLLPSEKSQYFIKFNMDGLLRGDYEKRMRGYSIGRQNGWLSANDIRRLEDMNPIPDGDEYLVNGSLCPIRMAGAAYQKKNDNNSN